MFEIIRGKRTLQDTSVADATPATPPTDLFGGLQHSSFEEYRNILERADNPHPTDFQRIKELVGDFGITLDQAKRDIQVIKRVKALAPLVPTVEEKAKMASEADGRYHAKKDELKALTKKLQAEMQALRNDYERKNVIYKDALDARQEHNELIEKNPRAMGRPWVKRPPSDPNAPVYLSGYTAPVGWLR